MNERIKEIAQNIERVRDFYNVGPVQRAAIEDFAELIVQECEQISLQSSHRDDDMGSIIARNIKQHFGVK